MQATRVADVAERAGVTIGTVYRYFRSKDALIQAALRHAAHPVRRVAVAERPGATLPALADALRRWGAFFRDAGMRSVRVTLSDPRRDASAPNGVIDAALQELAEIIVQGIARKEMRDDLAPAAIARALLGALLLDPLLDRATGAAGDDVVSVEAVSALATRGLRADGPSWKSAGA